ncbi:MAG: BrnA antitoxin family protein [Holophagaceae bacterium]
MRGPQKAPTKELVSIRLSRDVVETFRASGEGWQTRIDQALKEWLKAHRPA